MCLNLHAGGNWNNSVNCGSRSRTSNNVRSNVNTNIGSRSVIHGVEVMNWQTPKLIITHSSSLWLNTYRWLMPENKTEWERL